MPWMPALPSGIARHCPLVWAPLRATWTSEARPATAFEEIFELAEDGKRFEVYSRARLRRSK